MGSKITTDEDSAKDAVANGKPDFRYAEAHLEIHATEIEKKKLFYNSNFLSVLLYDSEC